MISVQKTRKQIEPSEIIDRTYSGDLTLADGVRLYSEPALLFRLADEFRKIAVGDVVSYVINRNINFTNICEGTCLFCAFRTGKGYVLTIDEILSKTREAADSGASEVCIQGGLLPGMCLEDYCEIIESIKSDFPEIHIHAFSPMEVLHASRNSGIEVSDALAELKKAGLGSMPGTAAEILDDRVRNIICPQKLTANEWVDVIMTAHRTGIHTTATIMYGHLESLEERINHLLIIRDIQKETHGFTEFVPLPFMPYNNKLGYYLLDENINVHRGIDDLKFHALARLMLHPYIKNIQASWVKLGKRLAQTALDYGVNDLGGTLMEEKISKSAGATSGEKMSPSEFDELIRNAGRVPKVRDTLYNILS